MDEGTGAPGRDELFYAVGTAFARLRRRTAQVKVDPPVTRKDLSRNLVLDLVDEADDEMTVSGLAEQLGVDPSVASRMVSDCISSGYLMRNASQRDGRRTVLQLTAQGVTLRDRFRRQQRQAFERITTDWQDEERVQFARLLVKYADSAERLGGAENP